MERQTGRSKKRGNRRSNEQIVTHAAIQTEIRADRGIGRKTDDERDKWVGRRTYM